MKKTAIWFVSAMMAVTSVGVTGCETRTRSGVGGAAVGATLGGVIGHQSGRAMEGAVIGGLAGVVVHDAKARRERSAQETAEYYRYEPAQGERLTFEQARVEPQVARRGALVEATSQYAILGADGGTAVTETWLLQRDGQTLSQLSSYTQTRNDGTWVSTLPFQVPNNLEPGQYRVMHIAQTGRSSISGSAGFVVQ